MFPAGFWSRERVRRFALQLEGERWASACPPLTPRSRSARTNPLATDEPFAVLYMLAPCLAFYFTYGNIASTRLSYMPPAARPSRQRRAFGALTSLFPGR